MNNSIDVLILYVHMRFIIFPLNVKMHVSFKMKMLNTKEDMGFISCKHKAPAMI